jgi:hypothetical protein
MAQGPSNFLFNPGLPVLQQLNLVLNITGAKTAAPNPLTNSALYYFCDAIAAQSTIDNFLGTTSEFTTTQFDATTMGTDTFGLLINMSGLQGPPNTTNIIGQAKNVVSMSAVVVQATGGTTQYPNYVQGIALLADSSNATQIAVGAYGNIALVVKAGNSFDGFTAGAIDINILWQSL